MTRAASLVQRGASATRLTVRKDNKEAIDLYKKLGFVRAGITPNYYNDGAAGVRMKVRFENVFRPGIRQAGTSR